MRGYIEAGVYKGEQVKKLVDAKEQVESRMESFRNLEKELKVKQWSKKALELGIDMSKQSNPEEKKKLECQEAIADLILSLRQSQELLEGELEEASSSSPSTATGGVGGGASFKGAKAGGGRGGGSRGPSDLTSDLEKWILRHADHIQCLEQILRMLGNDVVAADQINR